MRKLWILIPIVLIFACNLPSPTPVPMEAYDLVIPSATQTHEPTATPIVITATPTLNIPTTIPTPPDRYVVMPGDTIIGIAEKFGLSWGYLADQNKLKNPDFIAVGEVLKIPKWPPENEGRLIYVVLSEQKVYAIENSKVLKEFVVSTGTSEHPTVTGEYQIYVKYEFDDMAGPGYYLPKVPSVMYFYQGYGLHGTYWHNNFGVPMSHGCINLREDDAKWLFNWAEVGDTVKIVE